MKLGFVLYLYNTCSLHVCPWIWVKAVTSSHECMHHGAGVLTQTPPKNPLPRCGELPGLSHLPVTPSLSTHQWVRIRSSLSAGRGEKWKLGGSGLQSMHLNNDSMFQKWPHGWEVIGFSCAACVCGGGLPCFHLVICENPIMDPLKLWLQDCFTDKNK